MNPEPPNTQPTWVRDTGTLRIVLAGDVDGPAMQASLEDMAGELDDSVQSLVVDLHECRFIGATGVDVLGTLVGRAAEHGATVELQGASPGVSLILGIAGLLDLAQSSGREGDQG